ncbi:hypothetical protein GCK72_018162 [Caenorhabditis remanei]|uniref:Class II aldolase/adducin N-terminal domain-containing protein n=1 Tax=Caenorhabditis remanei TaxID=31234 RepID=A0A6A5G922_CAERE|nr:hypothetical protein GCK72_018162 [Caenorhabditis remanei]KAF1751608.1 hypothetical protein GCK72_018162 [Caenorhabditis remanei]
MSDDSGSEINVEFSAEQKHYKSAPFASSNLRIVTVSDRTCLTFPKKMSKPEFITIMQNAENNPELINDTPPVEPGFGRCEVFVMNKNIQKAKLGIDNFTPWHKGGVKRSLERQHSYFYTIKESGQFVPSHKDFATHVLRISLFVLASCHALNKKIYRMFKIDDPTTHCLPSLIVYTFEPGFERPTPNSPAVLNRKALDDILLNANISQYQSPSTSLEKLANGICSPDSFNSSPKRAKMEGDFESTFDMTNFGAGPSGMREPKLEIEGSSTGSPIREEEEIDYSINNRPSLFNVQTSHNTPSSSKVQQNHSKFQNYDMFSAGVISNATVPAPMFHPRITPIADLDNEDGKIDSEELIQRNKLAALYRLVDLFRWSQGIYNHITVRVSSNPDEILINAFGQLYCEISASSLIKVDLDGTVIDGGSTHFGVNQAGYVLHSAVHNARPEVKCVVHLHHPSVVAVSAQKCGLLPISQEAMIVGEVGYHEYRGILIDEAERALLVRDLGDRHVMILRNHGFVVCGESIEHALSLTYHLIIACETQVKTVPGGNTDNVHFPAQAAIKQVYKVASNGGGGVNRQNGHVNSTQWRKGELEWQAYMRQMDAQGYVTGHVYD